MIRGCNVCGREFNEEDDIFEAQEVESFEVTGGYGNRQWGDCVHLRWRACQDCLAAWFRTFAVPPQAHEVEPFVPGRFQPVEFSLPKLPDKVAG